MGTRRGDAEVAVRGSNGKACGAACTEAARSNSQLQGQGVRGAERQSSHAEDIMPCGSECCGRTAGWATTRENRHRRFASGPFGISTSKVMGAVGDRLEKDRGEHGHHVQVRKRAARSSAGWC